MTEGFRSQVLGAEPNEARVALQRKEGIEELIKGIWTAEPVLVTEYHFAKQQVDVKLMNYPNTYREMKEVPIYNTAGSLSIHQSFDTTSRPELSPGDVGILLFTRTESDGSFEDRTLTGDHAPNYHKGDNGIFIPGPITTNESPPDVLDSLATATDLDDVGPNDAAIVHESGSHIIFKENGEVIIKGKEIYFGSDENDVTNFKKVAREGDAVGGDGATTIQEGSDTVKAGD